MSEQPPTRPEDLPRDIPVFPLSGIVLFPRGLLPLNIFEPRYLNMIDDAIQTHRLIGMVQTTGGPKHTPHLANIGGLGEITGYDETEDGRYMIMLTGVCRFRIAKECDVRTPYRQVRADWRPYLTDFEPEAPEHPGLRQAFISALAAFVNRESLTADWESIRSASLESLVHALGSGGKFSPEQKQALLEAPDLAARVNGLISLFEGAGPPTGKLQ